METRRFLWFMALVFSLVLLVQYIELPYAYILSSLSSFGKSQVTSADTKLSSNGTTLSDANELRDGNNPSAEKNGSSSVGSNLEEVYPSTDVLRMKSNSRDDSAVENMTLAPETGHSVNNSSFDNLQAAKGAPASDKNDSKPCREESSNTSSFGNNTSTSANKKRFKGPPAVVVPISKMNDMLRESRSSFRSMKPKWPSQGDEELLNAKKLIENAPIMEKMLHIDVNVYRNYSAFIRSYELMEHTLKVYIYTEGEKPIFHQGELTGIYASEGWFMKQLEENKHFVTRNADKAHLFYLPFSLRMLEETLYVPDSHSRRNLVRYLSNYLQNITKRHPFWDRSSGSDHFLVGCHDWAPAETSRIMNKCIRSLCNADVKGGFQFGKDVSLPEIYIHDTQNPLKDLGGKPPSQRHILAFFAGKMHGYLRPILLKYWENKDPDMKIFGKLKEAKVKKKMSYAQYMKSSKYCISAKGYEAYTPRVIEAIFFECVPVIISDNYVPPFFETLNWESFAVFVLERDIPNLKNILTSIPQEKYLKMQERVRQVQKHFLWHENPVKYDVFHMILHSVWYTRVFQMKSG